MIIIHRRQHQERDDKQNHLKNIEKRDIDHQGLLFMSRLIVNNNNNEQ
jgi:hypothetical protein